MFKRHSASNFHPLLTMIGLIFRYQAAFLEDALGVPRHRLKRMVVAVPALLSYNVEDNLKPKVTNVFPAHIRAQVDGNLFSRFSLAFDVQIWSSKRLET